MSKLLVQGNVVHTPRAVFTEEDKKALSMYDSFEGFQIQNIKLSQIFSEFSDSIDLPEKVGTEDSLLCNKIIILTPTYRCSPSCNFLHLYTNIRG